MPQAEGSQSYLIYQEETTFGITPGTPAAKKIYFKSEGLNEDRPLLVSKAIRGNRNPIKPVRGNISLGGPIATELSPQMGSMLKGALGTVNTTGSGPYEHTIKVGSLPSFTFERGFTDLGIYLLMNGLKINNLTLNVRSEGFQDMSIDFLGANEAQILLYDGQTGDFTIGDYVTGGSSGAKGLIIADNDSGTSGFLTLIDVSGTFQDDETITDEGTGSATVDGLLGDTSFDSSPTDNGHTAWDGFSISAIQEGGSDIAVVREVDISIINNLDGSSYAIGGKGKRRYLPADVVEVSGTMKAMFESMVQYNKAVKYEESSLKINYKFGTGAGTDGNENLEILIPELVYAKKTPVIESALGIYYEGPFHAYYDNSSEASAIQMILKNAEATI